MSNATKPNRASWLRLDDVTEPKGAAVGIWDECKTRLGYIREFLKLPFEPDRLALFQGYVNRLMRSPDCQLSGVERELIALIVSIENRCPPCIITHAGALRAHGMEPATIDLVLSNWRHAPLSERERALAELAANLTIAPADHEEADLDEVREAGVGELEILEAVQIIAIFNATNRLNSGLGIKVDPAAHAAFRAG
ncbi:MAG: peroxidase-related enzyme [Hyphomicrobiaceae bacterium]